MQKDQKGHVIPSGDYVSASGLIGRSLANFKMLSAKDRTEQSVACWCTFHGTVIVPWKCNMSAPHSRFSPDSMILVARRENRACRRQGRWQGWQNNGIRQYGCDAGTVGELKTDFLYKSLYLWSPQNREMNKWAGISSDEQKWLYIWAPL